MARPAGPGPTGWSARRATTSSPPTPPPRRPACSTRRPWPATGRTVPSLEAIGTERSPVPEYTCGSLGQGLSAAAGFALGDRLTGRDDARTFAFISDGELQEGQVWEAAMFAGHHRLARLTVLLDANNSQVDGPVDSITTIEPVAAKWRAFGWDAVDLDGHDVAAIAAALAGRRTGPCAALRVAHLPDLDPPRAGLPAAGRRRALHQAARGSRRGGRPPNSGRAGLGDPP